MLLGPVPRKHFGPLWLWGRVPAQSMVLIPTKAMGGIWSRRGAAPWTSTLLGFPTCISSCDCKTSGTFEEDADGPCTCKDCSTCPRAACTNCAGGPVGSACTCVEIPCMPVASVSRRRRRRGRPLKFKVRRAALGMALTSVVGFCISRTQILGPAMRLLLIHNVDEMHASHRASHPC